MYVYRQLLWIKSVSYTGKCLNCNIVSGTKYNLDVYQTLLIQSDLQ